jgi:hypothetical protein
MKNILGSVWHRYKVLLLLSPSWWNAGCLDVVVDDAFVGVMVSTKDFDMSIPPSVWEGLKRQFLDQSRLCWFPCRCAVYRRWTGLLFSAQLRLGLVAESAAGSQTSEAYSRTGRTSCVYAAVFSIASQPVGMFLHNMNPRVEFPLATTWSIWRFQVKFNP